MYRTFSMASGVAGLQPIEVQSRKIVNIDLTDIVTGKILNLFPVDSYTGMS